MILDIAVAHIWYDLDQCSCLWHLDDAPLKYLVYLYDECVQVHNITDCTNSIVLHQQSSFQTLWDYVLAGENWKPCFIWWLEKNIVHQTPMNKTCEKGTNENTEEGVSPQIHM